MAWFVHYDFCVSVLGISKWIDILNVKSLHVVGEFILLPSFTTDVDAADVVST